MLFGIRFLVCNLFLTVLIGILLAAKRILDRHLSRRMQYNLWFLMLALLTVPFLPFRPIGFWRNPPSVYLADAGSRAANAVSQNTAMNRIHDFAISVNQETPSALNALLLAIWFLGMLAVLLFLIKSQIHLHRLERSALPLQNEKVSRLFEECLREMKLSGKIAIYSTAFLKSPITVGLFSPAIYVPIHLISDLNVNDMRYMLLHELQHCKHKDTLSNHLMNLVYLVYWFHPLVRYALKEMRSDCELVCDSFVLQMLDEADYKDYGNTLINFAEKLSVTSFPFTAGFSGSMKQMERRIRNIASYQPPSLWKKLKGILAFGMTAMVLFLFAPLLSTYGAQESRYQWNSSEEHISYADYSAYFDGYEGSFVLYDLENDSYTIYNQDRAALQVSPNSTYKIYNALFSLEEHIITPERSLMAWNKEQHPFAAWNADQDLHSAMRNSVNWYFQSLDAQLGSSVVKNYLQKIEYGNQNMGGDFSSYWMESSLKISPIEQVKLLQKLYRNDFGFHPDNLQAVKDSIFLAASPNGSFYGKTGTGRVNHQDVNGWFIGYAESSGHTCFFATNMQADTNASGSNAAKITQAILSVYFDIDIPVYF